MRFIHLIACLVLHATRLTKAAYSIQQIYAGSTFFDGWSYWANNDNLTNGNTYYVARNASQSVAYLNSNGNVILKVDNSSDLGNNGLRNSVRLTSTTGFGMGTLFVFDAVHIPYGCSVWPAFWVHGAEWPSGGEIDIIEGVNMQPSNQVALHTVTGCYSGNDTLATTGQLISNNCDHLVNGNQGCTVLDGRNQSYGPSFSQGGGGVYAMELASSGISVWFFPRAAVPADLSSNSSSPDPVTWSPPVAFYSNSSCNINSYFAQQYITLNIALCGDWAGNPAVYAQTCTGSCSTAVALARTYANAYFEIVSLRVYSGGLNTQNNRNISTIASDIGSQPSPKSTANVSKRSNRIIAVAASLVGIVAFVIGI